MKVTAIRSDKIYKKMIEASIQEKADIFRYELMKPFEYKWSLIGVPLKAEQAGGYDVTTMTSMGGGFLPERIDGERVVDVEKIGDDEFWGACERSIKSSLDGFIENDINLPTKEYIFTVLLNDSAHPMSKLTGDYCGDGGIPGYIIGTIIPNKKSLAMLPVALAHEANHNVRWQFMEWSPQITLGDMIVSEGLAENFAAHMFGEDKVGKWVKSTTNEMLENIIKPIIKDNLELSDFAKVSAYLYGDDVTSLQGGTPVGLPYCAGYACGYHLIKYYLEKTDKTIYEATIASTQDILDTVKEFWI